MDKYVTYLKNKLVAVTIENTKINFVFHRNNERSPCYDDCRFNVGGRILELDPSFPLFDRRHEILKKTVNEPHSNFFVLQYPREGNT